jgi:3-O-alpha-D-mannopyranosyl-alpha-D-mannopyranose xylosylphosphotransferase
MDGHIPGQPGSYPAGSTCTLSLSTCFPSDFFTSSTSYSAQSIFRGIAFEHPECGDCIINALITASGDRGLAAILPEAEAVFFPPEKEPRMWERSEPMLPLTSHWEGSDFSLAEVVRNGQDAWAGISPREDGGVRLREWCIKLLSRYAYTHGKSSFPSLATYKT